MKYILGNDSLTVFVDGKPYTINKQAHTYEMVLKAIRAGNEDQLRAAVNIRESIVTKLSKATSKVRIENGKIFYIDREITGLIASRIFEVLRLGLDVTPMVTFIENLMQNPSKRAVDELFGFLTACSLPITEDGHFLAYKRVRADYLDCHSRTIDNSLGTVVEMQRNMVDEDQNNTCSYGLHFCSYDYLKSFSGERIMVLKINPADVVAIPVDYNNSKGRTCRYEVVGELDVGSNNLPVIPLADGYTDEYASDTEVTPEEDEAFNAIPIAKVGQPKFDSATVRKAKHLLRLGSPLTFVAKECNISTRTAARIRDGEVAAYRNI